MGAAAPKSPQTIPPTSKLMGIMPDSNEALRHNECGMIDLFDNLIGQVT
jgi:hypothetical protein